MTTGRINQIAPRAMGSERAPGGPDAPTGSFPGHWGRGCVLVFWGHAGGGSTPGLSVRGSPVWSAGAFFWGRGARLPWTSTGGHGTSPGGSLRGVWSGAGSLSLTSPPRACPVVLLGVGHLPSGS